MDMKNINRQEVYNLYSEEKLSVRIIAERLSCSMWMLYKYMRTENIPRRTTAETSRIAFESIPLSFVQKRDLCN